MGSSLFSSGDGSDDGTKNWEELDEEVLKCIGTITKDPEGCRPTYPATDSFTHWLRKVYRNIYTREAPTNFANEAFFHSLIDYSVAEYEHDEISSIVMIHHAKAIWDAIPTPRTGTKQPTTELKTAYTSFYNTYIRYGQPRAVTVEYSLGKDFSNAALRDPPWSQPKETDPYHGIWADFEKGVFKGFAAKVKGSGSLTGAGSYRDSKYEKEFTDAQQAITAHAQYRNTLYDMYGDKKVQHSGINYEWQGYRSQGYRSQIMGGYNDIYHNSEVDWMLMTNVIGLMVIISLICCIVAIIICVFGFCVGYAKMKGKRAYRKQFDIESV